MKSELRMGGFVNVLFPIEDGDGVAYYTVSLLGQDRLYQLEAEGVGILDKFHEEMEILLLRKIRESIRTHRDDARKQEAEIAKGDLSEKQVKHLEDGIKGHRAMADGIEKLLDQLKEVDDVK